MLVLHEAGFDQEEAAVVQALRIYTADLAGRVVTGGHAPATLEPAALRSIAGEARQKHAAFVAWVARRDGRLVLYLLHETTLDLRETDVEASGLQSAAEALALKVRALLTGSGDAGPTTRSGTAPPAAPLPSGAPVIAAVAASQSAVTVQREPRTGQWLALGASYGFWLPSQTEWLRHGLRLVAEVRAGGPLSFYADGAITTHPTRTVNGSDVTFADVPFGLGAAMRRQWDRLGVAGGPRASLHIMDVNANPPVGPSGDVRRFSAGLGALFAVDLRLSGRLRASLGLSLEALLPAQQFTARQQTVLRTGAALFGASAGVALLLP